LLIQNTAGKRIYLHQHPIHSNLNAPTHKQDKHKQGKKFCLAGNPKVFPYHFPAIIGEIGKDSKKIDFISILKRKEAKYFFYYPFSPTSTNGKTNGKIRMTKRMK